ncbi:MAG: ribonuclease H-like domain-containing protein, partial [Deltaproteobacteria bacterium]|nr:ribonuclease H-like domain-containing protein [Deltaproteobacteria bacterium]
MIRSSFLHVPGMKSPKKERKLWGQGILSWEDLMEYRLGLPGRGARNLQSQQPGWYADSLSALERGDMGYFLERMPAEEHYRLALTWPWEALFLDIETTGLIAERNHITLIGWSLAGRFNVYVPGHDSGDLLLRDLSSAKVLVTFNGKIFDLRFLEREFRGLRLPRIHVDLRYFTQRLGMKGGQKTIEKRLGLVRPGSSGDGHEAIRRYGEYRSGNELAMEELILYNRADVEGMKLIFDACVAKQIEKGYLPNLPGLGQTFSALVERSAICLREPEEAPPDPRPARAARPKPMFEFEALECLASLRQPTLVGLCPLAGSRQGSAVAIISGHKGSAYLLANHRELMVFLSLAKPRLVAVGCPDEPGLDPGGHLVEGCGQVMDCLRQLRRMGQAALLVSKGSVKEVLGLAADEGGLGLTDVLADFGLRGDFHQSPDPALEALVAALAGYFFWSGKFRFSKWGTERVVLADRTSGPPLWRERTVIGLSGPHGAGKSTAAKFLEAKYHFVPIQAKLLTAGNLMADFLPGLDHFMGARKLVVDSLSRPEDVALWRGFLGPAFINCRILRPPSRKG